MKVVNNVLTITNPGNQVSLNYDVTHSALFAVSSTGILTISPTGITLKLTAATTVGASLNIPTGAAPTTPNVGDVWLLSSTGIQVYYGSTAAVHTLTDLDSAQTITSKTFSTGNTWNGNVVTYQYGGTGTSAAPTNGQVHIGNGSGFTLATITPGIGILIANATGSITVTDLSQAYAANLITATSAITTTETIILKTPLMPANRFSVGSRVRVSIRGTATATGSTTPVFSIRIGTAGTTADTLAFTATGTSASPALLGGTNVVFNTYLEMNVTAIGSSSTITGNMQIYSGGANGISSTAVQNVLPTVAAFNNTNANFLTVTYKSTAAGISVTIQECFIEFQHL